MGKMIKIMDLVHTGPQIWAAFDGTSSYATLLAPLHLQEVGDYIDYDIIMPPCDGQPLRHYQDTDAWHEWYANCFAQAIIGSRSPRSCLSWFTAGATKARFDASSELTATGSAPASGTHHMRLQLGQGVADLIVDGTTVATFNHGSNGFTVSSIGDAAIMGASQEHMAAHPTETTLTMYTAFRIRALTVRAGGTVHDLGNLVDSPLLTCHNVKSVMI